MHRRNGWLDPSTQPITCLFTRDVKRACKTALHIPVSHCCLCCAMAISWPLGTAIPQDPFTACRVTETSTTRVLIIAIPTDEITTL